jgi:Fe2+ transport system protein FeoA
MLIILAEASDPGSIQTKFNPVTCLKTILPIMLSCPKTILSIIEIYSQLYFDNVIIFAIIRLMENEQIQQDIIPLSQAEVGKRYQVVSVKATGAINQRMLDMGLVPGIRLWVVRFAPLGDPIEIRIRHFLMSLRKDEAKDVEVIDIGFKNGQQQHPYGDKGHRGGWRRHNRCKFNDE